MKKIVFIDMDGVLCDFASAAFRAHGQTYDPQTYPRGQWEMMYPLGLTSEADFWRKIHDLGHEFWADLERFAWVDELIDAARQVGEQVKILTSPAKSPQCFYGKYVWCQSRLPLGIEFIPCKSKFLLAASDRILIDDSDSNISKWRDAGGVGVLFPQPWNELHERMNARMDHVRSELGLI